MARGRTILFLVVGVVVAAAAVVMATRLEPERVVISADPGQLGENLGLGPSIPSLRARGWLNSDHDIAPAALRGRVVVFDFWTSSSVNCVRTVPWLRAWEQRYGPDGLTIVGVHSPQFSFERDHDNVAAAVESLGITWPVALDDGRDIWDAFGNRYWPALYVFDRDSRLRFTHFGEGAYERTEDVLRALLGIAPEAPRAEPVGAVEASYSEHQTPEVHLGTERGTTSFLSPERLEDGTRRYSAPDPLVGEGAALVGRWQISTEFAEAASGMPEAHVAFVGGEINGVLGLDETKGAEPIVAVVEVDGGPVPEPYRGADLVIDGDGRTVVVVDRPGLYRLVVNGSLDRHVLRLAPQRPGLRAYAFSFGA